MGLEIERKFLLKKIPENIVGKIPPIMIRQGYISVDATGKEVRLRQKGPKYFLTIKSAGDLEREEYNVQLSKAQFDTLWPATKGKRLTKQRYATPLSELLLEIDVYEGMLSGLILAEIEFPDKEQALNFHPPGWMGKEVTYAPEFKNKSLWNFKDIQELLNP